MLTDDIQEISLAEIEKLIISRNQLIMQKVGSTSPTVIAASFPIALSKKITGITERLTGITNPEDPQMRELFIEFYNALTDHCIERKYIYMN